MLDWDYGPEALHLSNTHLENLKLYNLKMYFNLHGLFDVLVSVFPLVGICVFKCHSLLSLTTVLSLLALKNLYITDLFTSKCPVDECKTLLKSRE